jgi:hypothetical protein
MALFFSGELESTARDGGVDSRERLEADPHHDALHAGANAIELARDRK